MLLESFLTYLKIEKNSSFHTLQAYEKDLNDLREYMQEQYQISLDTEESVRTMSHRMLRSWMGHLLNQDLSPRTVARKVSAVKSWFKYLQRKYGLEHNPAARIKLPRFEKKLPSVLRPAQINHLLDEVTFPDDLEGKRDKCILEIFYGCGLRRSELLNLRPEHVDLNRQSFRVLGKGAKERIVPFGKHVRAALDIYLEACREEGIVLKERLIVKTDGKALYPRLLYDIVHKYLSEVSTLATRSPHVLRHTYATHLLDQGADLNAIKELLGHSSLAATQVYTHNTISKLKKVHRQAHPRSGE